MRPPYAFFSGNGIEREGNTFHVERSVDAENAGLNATASEFVCRQSEASFVECNGKAF